MTGLTVISHCKGRGIAMPGKRITDFLIRNAKVSRVTVGFVID